MKRTYRTSQTAGNSPDKEKNYGKSQTVPDQAMTIREIMTRFVNNTLDDISLQGEYTEDLPDLRHYDVIQKDELIQISREQSKQARENVKKSADENREMKRKIKEQEKQKDITDAQIIDDGITK